MKLIPQKNFSSCWFASAQMLIEWKRANAFASQKRHPDPSEVKEIITWEVAGNGLINPKILRMAKLLGMRSMPPICPSLSMIEDYLRRYGPLWTNGKEHIVVVAGADQSSGRLLVYDPWPPKVGKIEWRPFVGWYMGAVPPGADDPDSSRDTGKAVRATFLFLP